VSRRTLCPRGCAGWGDAIVVASNCLSQPSALSAYAYTEARNCLATNPTASKDLDQSIIEWVNQSTINLFPPICTETRLYSNHTHVVTTLICLQRTARRRGLCTFYVHNPSLKLATSSSKRITRRQNKCHGTRFRDRRSHVTRINPSSRSAEVK